MSEARLLLTDALISESLRRSKHGDKADNVEERAKSERAKSNPATSNTDGRIIEQRKNAAPGSNRRVNHTTETDYGDDKRQ